MSYEIELQPAVVYTDDIHVLAFADHYAHKNENGALFINTLETLRTLHATHPNYFKKNGVPVYDKTDPAPTRFIAILSDCYRLHSCEEIILRPVAWW